jgi:hypothetical protein
MFTNEDVQKYRALRECVKLGKFDLEGKAVVAAASLFHWFYVELEQKIMQSQTMKIEENKDNIPPEKQKRKRRKTLIDGNDVQS